MPRDASRGWSSLMSLCYTENVLKYNVFDNIWSLSFEGVFLLMKNSSCPMWFCGFWNNVDVLRQTVATNAWNSSTSSFLSFQVRSSAYCWIYKIYKKNLKKNFQYVLRVCKNIDAIYIS